jgi:Transglutaminase-like domain
MNKLGMFFISVFILGWSNVSPAANSLPDEPEAARDLSISFQGVDSYSGALDLWKTAEDINKWIAGSFIYDKARAINLSSNQRTKNRGIPVYDPSVFFESKTGVCVDLARFGVETLRIIDPNSDPKYLMIEFDPIQINGNTFRLHWLVSFKRGGMKYFFCDSKRPGYIAGPYKSTQEFISEYEKYRGRRIAAYRELESYQKQRKSQSTKVRVTKSSNKPNAADR